MFARLFVCANLAAAADHLGPRCPPLVSLDDQLPAASRTLLDQLQTSAPPKNREVEAAKARARAAKRYAS